MKHLLLVLLLFPVAARSIAQNDAGGTPLNALVTVRIAHLDEALWSAVNARIAKSSNTNVEYSCLNTGIVVLRIQHIAVAEKSDVIILVKRMLREAGVKGAVEFLDVHVDEGDGNKCCLPNGTRAMAEG